MRKPEWVVNPDVRTRVPRYQPGESHSQEGNSGPALFCGCFQGAGVWTVGLECRLGFPSLVASVSPSVKQECECLSPGSFYLQRTKEWPRVTHLGLSPRLLLSVVTPLRGNPGTERGRTWPCFHSDSWKSLNWEVTVPMQPELVELPGSWRAGGGEGLVPRGVSHAVSRARLTGGLVETPGGACLRPHSSQGRTEPAAPTRPQVCFLAEAAPLARPIGDFVVQASLT